MEPSNQKPEGLNLPLLGPGRPAEYTITRSQYVEIPVTAPSASQEPEDGPDEGGLLGYWRILNRHRGALLISVFLGGLVGLLVTVPQTPIYQAHTSIEIVGLNENFLNFRQASPITETGTTSETSDIQTQIKILGSESLMERVIGKLEAERFETTAKPTHWDQWRKVLHLPLPTQNAVYEKALRSAAKSLKVKAAGQTRILDLTVDSTDPRMAAVFANTLANEFIEQNLESRWKTTEKTSDWLARQLDDMRIKLERSEDALQQYARNSGLIFTDEKTNVSEDKLHQMQAELSSAQADRIAKQSRYETAQSSPPDALPDVLNDTALREIQSKITDLKQQVAELSTTYTSEYSKLKRLQAQMATLQTAFDQNRKAILDRIHNEYQEALRREKLLSAAYESQTKLVSGEGEKSIQYNILKREVDSNRQLYEAMLQQLKESTIASAMRASNVRVVDPAKVPSKPYKPQALVCAGIGMLGGLFLGATLIIVRERGDRTIQQPGDAAFYLKTPELGIIPSAGLQPKRQRYVSITRSQPRMLPLNDESGRNLPDLLELATWQQKPSIVAESFRSTLISILFAGEGSARPKVLVLTSAGPAEGKSTVASNLAIAIAEVGHRVLLMDADMRRPRQHDIFRLDNSRGLSTILRERTQLNGDHTLGGLLRPSEVPGLTILTSGPGTSAATNLLYGSHMPELLNYLRKHFDTVLIDTPPMLQISDARVLGRMADKVIMVVRAGHTTRDAAVAARQRFAEDGTTILGTVLNDWNPKSARGGYYGYSGGYYGYYERYHKSDHGEKSKLG